MLLLIGSWAEPSWSSIETSPFGPVCVQGKRLVGLRRKGKPATVVGRSVRCFFSQLARETAVLEEGERSRAIGRLSAAPGHDPGP